MIEPREDAPAASWRKFYELIYAGLIGFEVAFILDLLLQLRR
jgi:hypothetical protein